MPRISLRQDDWQRAKRRLRAIQRELGATEAQFRNSLPAYAIPALATAKRLAPSTRAGCAAISHIASQVAMCSSARTILSAACTSAFRNSAQGQSCRAGSSPAPFVRRRRCLAFRLDLGRRVSTGQGVADIPSAALRAPVHIP